MQNENSRTGGNADLLTAIYGIEICRESQISASDREYCEQQQKALYATLEQLEQWYRIFADDAEKYRESYRLEYKPDGKIVPHKPYAPYNDNPTDYEDMEFKPFESIDSIVKMNHCAQSAFAERIVRYFNRTYNVSVSVPQIDYETLTIGFRPEYTTYVDAVIEHLGGRSFRSTAEEELLKRFLDKVKPGYWSKTKPELKGNKIVFPDIVRFDDFYFSYGTNHIHYNYTNDIDRFCEGIVFAADDRLDGNKMAIIGFDCNDVDLNRWYELTTDNTVHMRFYKNGRIDVRFEDADSADRCYRKLRLDEIEIPVRI